MADVAPQNVPGSRKSQVQEVHYSENLCDEVLHKLRVSLMEIAALAELSKSLSIDAISQIDNGGTPNSIICSSQVIAEKIGFIADLCAEMLGGGSLHGGAEDWLMPPSYNWADRLVADRAVRGGAQ